MHDSLQEDICGQNLKKKKKKKKCIAHVFAVNEMLICHNFAIIAVNIMLVYYIDIYAPTYLKPIYVNENLS